MKKIKNFKSIPVIAVIMLLLISAISFPVLAERFQIKGMEKGAKNLEINSLKMPDLVAGNNQNHTKVGYKITMTEEEEKIFDEVASTLQKSTLLRMLENRELHEMESSRMVELRKEFRTGNIKTEKTLPIGENLNKPYFDPESETYYYPVVEMTDEQLLQIIDFDEKLFMVFSKISESYIQKVMDNSDIKISEEEAIKSANDAVERIYGVELDNMEIKSTFSLDEVQNNNSWRIIFEPKNLEILKEQEKLYWMYFVEVDIHSGKVNWIDSYYSNQKVEREGSAETDLNDIDDHKRIAEEVLTNKLNAKNTKFQKAYIRKPIPVSSFNKSLYLVYKAEDKYIEFEFLYGSKRMVALFFFDDSVKLNERINEREQESTGYIIANKITSLEHNGRKIPANSQTIQLKDGARIVALEGSIKYDPENTIFNLQKNISDEIFKNIGMRMDCRLGALKYEPKDKIDITKTKLELIKTYPLESNLKELNMMKVLPYKLEKGTFAAQSEKDFEAGFYLENGEYAGKIDSEFNHDTGLYELDTEISGVKYYIVVFKNISDDDLIDIRYIVSN